MDYTTIEKFKFWCNKVLPLVYDDSLSYYEVLCKVVDYLNKCIEGIDYLMEVYAPVVGQVSELQSQLEQLKVELKASLIALNERCTALEDANEENYKSLKNYIDEVNTPLKQDIETLYSIYNNILSLYNSFKTYADSVSTIAYNKSTDYTDEKIKRIIQYIENPKLWFVVDPVDGNLKDIQTVIDEIFSLMRWGAFTTEEFDSAGYTCEYIDSIGFTAIEFDFYGRLRFMFSLDYVTKDELSNELLKYATLETLDNYALKSELANVAYKDDLIVYNPLTGLKNTIQQIINALASLHQNGDTCEELDGSPYTAQTYDNIGYTAYEFDFVGIL